MAEELGTYDDALAAGFTTFSANELTPKEEFGISIFPVPTTLGPYLAKEFVPKSALTLPGTMVLWMLDDLAGPGDVFPNFYYTNGIMPSGVPVSNLTPVVLDEDQNTVPIPFVAYNVNTGNTIEIGPGGVLYIYSYDSVLNSWILQNSGNVNNDGTIIVIVKYPTAHKSISSSFFSPGFGINYRSKDQCFSPTGTYTLRNYDGAFIMQIVLNNNTSSNYNCINVDFNLKVGYKTVKPDFISSTNPTGMKSTETILIQPYGYRTIYLYFKDVLLGSYNPLLYLDLNGLGLFNAQMNYTSGTLGW